MFERLRKIYREQPGEHIFKPETPYERFPVIKLGLVFSMPLLRLLQKINIKFNPFYLSITGLLCNTLAGVSFSQGYLIRGALLFFIAFIFDLVDGPWARLTNKQSMLFMEKFDPLCDRIGKVACFGGLCYYQPSILALIISYYLFEVYATLRLPDRFKNPRNWSFSPWEASFLILFMGPVLNMVHIFSALGITLLASSYIIKIFKRY